MPYDLHGQSVPELFEFLLGKYNEQELGAVGQAMSPAPVDSLMQQLSPHLQGAAIDGVNHFLAFARQFMLDHPPHSHIMLAQGFGVELAGGFQVSLVPLTVEEAPGIMEPANDLPVTSGMGRSSVTDQRALPITGG